MKATIFGSPLRALLFFEMKIWRQNKINFFALGALALFLFLLKSAFSGQLVMNGKAIGVEYRVIYLLAIGYSVISVLTTLYTLSLALERTGSGFLKQNDWLILARNVSRPLFYSTKLISLSLAAIAFSVISLIGFWITIYLCSGQNLYRLLWLIIPLSLSQTVLLALFLALRQYMGAFALFFGFLLTLPILYIRQLWQYYGGIMRGDNAGETVFHVLPSFGGIHAFSLGVVQDFYYRESAWISLINISLWGFVAVFMGIMSFRKKRM